jgi:hypothetical protein
VQKEEDINRMVAQSKYFLAAVGLAGVIAMHPWVKDVTALLEATGEASERKLVGLAVVYVYHMLVAEVLKVCACVFREYRLTAYAGDEAELTFVFNQYASGLCQASGAEPTGSLHSRLVGSWTGDGAAVWGRDSRANRGVFRSRGWVPGEVDACLACPPARGTPERSRGGEGGDSRDLG